jgi:hypothetical protein
MSSRCVAACSEMISGRRFAICLFVLVLELAFAFQPVTAESSSIDQNGNGPSQVLCLIVKNSLYSVLRERLLRWKSDKESLGAQVIIRTVSNENASAIRGYLASIPHLTGCLLVGDIPYVEFEWNYTDVNGTVGYDRFPSDLYYMNLHSDWIDSNGNGAYDKIVGDLSPDIWVGRLKASNLSGDEIQLLENYFDKNHNYLTGGLSTPQRALVYVDEVTNYYVNTLAPATATDLRYVYPDVVAVNDPKYTNASDYMARLKQPFSLVRTVVHGNATGETFLYNRGWDGLLSSSKLRNLDPNASFYVITSCHNFDYRQRDYMGAWYLFGSHGLFAMGDSSVRDILNVLPEWFFPALKTKSFGDAYVTWARETVKQNQNAINVIDYVLLGDPSLGITPSHPLPEFPSFGSLTDILGLLALTIVLLHRKKITWKESL